MKKNLLHTVLAVVCSATLLTAQQGKNGTVTVTATNTIVNEYTQLTANVGVGATSVSVANSTLNANGRFISGGLQPGDLIMIYTVQGAWIRNQFDVGATDTTFGKIQSAADYWDCGKYEYCQVLSVPNATTINLVCGTKNSYGATGGAIRGQVIRVPRYAALTVNAGASVTCDDWNGTVGGVLAVEVQGNCIINGTVDATGRGFRGGSLVGDNSTTFGSNTTYSTNAAIGAQRGEGVVGYQGDYTVFGGMYGRAPAGNAGAGGDAHNAGGGGGANGRNSTSASAIWSGNGVPDPTYTAAWNLEPVVNTMSLRTNANSAGGGRGGYSFSDQNLNAALVGPGNGSWGGDSRNHQATGLGGRPIDYHLLPDRYFFGGGGGAGDQNQNMGGNGGDGGGFIHLMVFGNISGSGTIVSNGAVGANAQGTPAATSYAGNDGAGGGGGGGAICINAVGTITGVSATANGGAGGNQVMTRGGLMVGPINEAEGPGGGGGGGHIAVSGGAITRTANGGNNGTTNSDALTEFPPNGATRGASGTNNATTTNWNIVAPADQTICAGQSVNLTAVVSGTTPVGYTAIWYADSTTGTSLGTGLSYNTGPLTVGTHTFWVGTCPGWWRDVVVITVGPPPTTTASASASSICNGQSTTLTGGGATTYTWMPGSLSGTSVSVSPTTTTTYTVTGATGSCTSTAQITITVNGLPTVTASTSSSTICAGQSVNLTGGGANTYLWNPGAVTGSPVSVSPSATTTYTVVGTNTTTGCTNTAQVVVNVNTLPTVTASAASTTLCVGQSTNLTGGGANTYLWNPGSLTGSPVSVSPSATTTYTVTGTNTTTGCTNTSQVTVTVNNLPVVTASASSATICAGQSTTLTGAGANTYTWNPGALSGSPISVTPSATTTYTVTGTNTTTGCTNTAQVAVTVNPSPTVTVASSASVICVGQSATLTSSGASSYVWNPGNISGGSINVTPGTTTTYTVTGTGANGCTSNSQTTITVNPVPVVTATPSGGTICAGNSISVTASGAASYTWNPGSLTGTSQVLSPSATTTYTLIGSNASGCNDTLQFTVTVNSTPTVTVTSSATTICNGASVTLSASGSNTYLWQPGNISGTSVSVTPSSTTTYTVTGTDVSGCSDTDQITVTVNPLPIVTVSSTPNTICAGQAVSLSAGGGSTYVWNGGGLVAAGGATQTDSPVVNTTYSVTVTTAAGCSDSSTVSVTVNPNPVANAGIDQAICTGSTVALNGNGGGVYVWNGGGLTNASGAAQTDAPTATTDYVLQVTDGNGCTDNDTVSIVVNALPVVTAGNDIQICLNSSTQLNASGAVSYVWTPAIGLSDDSIANPVAGPLVNTTYVVTGIDANGCMDTDTVTITIGNNLTVFASNDITICPGDTAQITVAGGSIWNWGPSASLDAPNAQTTNAFPSVTTTYTVNVTDPNGCVGSDSVTVFINPAVNLTATGTSTICIGQSATLTATPSGGSGSYTYVWDNSLTGAGPHVVTPAATTVYNVYVTDSIGCNSTVQTLTVTVNPPLTLNAIAGSSVCSGSSTNVTASGSGGDNNLVYTWLPGNLNGASQTLNPATTTTYTVILTDGCTTPADTQTVTVTVNALPVVTVTSSVSSGCMPLCVSFTETSSSNCVTSAWQFGDGNTSTSSAPTNCYAQAGSYDVTYTCTDANGCVGSSFTAGMINVSPAPSASFAVTPSGTIQVDQSGTQVCMTDLSSGANAWTWILTEPSGTQTSNQQSPCFTISDTGSYSVMLIVRNSQGCTDTTTMTFNAENPCTDIFVPNAFSPNGDNQNDTFFVYGSCISFMQLEIYNRWGERVFITTNQANGWDGSWRGQACEAAVFTYVLTGQMDDGTVIEKQGNISLVK